jgi:hypothetical protein
MLEPPFRETDSGGWGRFDLAGPGTAARQPTGGRPARLAASYPQRRRNVNNILQIILNLILLDPKSDPESIGKPCRRDRQEKSSTTFLRKPGQATSACNKPWLRSGHI